MRKAINFFPQGDFLRKSLEFIYSCCLVSRIIIGTIVNEHVHKNKKRGVKKMNNMSSYNVLVVEDENDIEIAIRAYLNIKCIT